jgi:hypothetical protein
MKKEKKTDTCATRKTKAAKRDSTAWSREQLFNIGITCVGLS